MYIVSNLENMKMHPLEYLARIDSVSGRNDKIAILTQMINEHPHHSKLIFSVALDPQISTFITKKPEVTSTSPQMIEGEPLYLVLHTLASGYRYSKAEWSDVAATLQQAYPLSSDQKYIWMILTKDLTIGASISSFNKALSLSEYNGRILPIVEYDTVRVSNIEDADINPSESLVAIKKDGANATYARKFISRNGHPIPLKHLDDAFGDYADQYVFFGELVSTDRQSSSGLVNSAIKKGHDSDRDVHKLQFHVFDCMLLAEYNAIYSGTLKESTWSYNYRIATAHEVIREINHPDIKVIQQWEVDSIEEVYEMYDKFVSQGEEGIIWNDKDMKFRIERSTKRARIKEVLDGDFEIIGFNEHSKKPGFLGSFVFRSACGLLTANTGSGLSDEQRKYFWDHRDDHIGALVKVKYNKVIPSATEEGKFTLFLPVLDTKDLIRIDKKEADNLKSISWGNKDAAKKKWLNSLVEGE